VIYVGHSRKPHPPLPPPPNSEPTRQTGQMPQPGKPAHPEQGTRAWHTRPGPGRASRQVRCPRPPGRSRDDRGPRQVPLMTQGSQQHRVEQNSPGTRGGLAGSPPEASTTAQPAGNSHQSIRVAQSGRRPVPSATAGRRLARADGTRGGLGGSPPRGKHSAAGPGECLGPHAEGPPEGRPAPSWWPEHPPDPAFALWLTTVGGRRPGHMPQIGHPDVHSAAQRMCTACVGGRLDVHSRPVWASRAADERVSPDPWPGAARPRRRAGHGR
jgi:hypothetical protein